MSELKPCPFCGGEPSLSSGYMGYSTVGIYVECINCAAFSEMNPEEGIAVEAWNKRV